MKVDQEMDPVQKIVNAKLQQSFGSLNNRILNLSVDHRLAWAFRVFEEDLKFQRAYIQALNQQNAELKVREIQLITQNSELKNRRTENSYKQRSQNKALDNNKCRIKDHQTLASVLRQRQQEIHSLKIQLEKDRKQIEDLISQKGAIQTRFKTSQLNIQQLHKNQKVAKVRQTNLENQIEQLKKDWRIKRAEDQAKLLKELAQTLSNNQAKLQEDQIKKMQQANKKIEQKNEIIKKIIKTVDSIWLLSGLIFYTQDKFEESNIQSWIKKMAQTEKKLERQIEKVVRPSSRAKKSHILQIAERQKERIAAKRYYLLKNVTN